MEKESKIYGFAIGQRVIEIKAISEKHAMLQLVNNYWEFIDVSGDVKLLGEAERIGTKQLKS